MSQGRILVSVSRGTSKNSMCLLLNQGSANCSSWAKFQNLSFTGRHPGLFTSVVVSEAAFELSSYERDHMAHKVKTVNNLALNRKKVVNPCPRYFLRTMSCHY